MHKFPARASFQLVGLLHSYLKALVIIYHNYTNTLLITWDTMLPRAPASLEGIIVFILCGSWQTGSVRCPFFAECHSSGLWYNGWGPNDITRADWISNYITVLIFHGPNFKKEPFRIWLPHGVRWRVVGANVDYCGGGEGWWIHAT